VVSEWDVEIPSVSFKRKVLIPDGSRSADVVYGEDDHGHVEIAPGAIGDLNRALNPLTTDSGGVAPFGSEWRFSPQHEFLLLLPGGIAAVTNYSSEL